MADLKRKQQKRSENKLEQGSERRVKKGQKGGNRDCGKENRK